MVGYGNFMFEVIVLKHTFKLHVAKVASSITDEYSKSTKSIEDVFLEEFYNNFHPYICFHPYKHIIYRY